MGPLERLRTETPLFLPRRKSGMLRGTNTQLMAGRQPLYVELSALKKPVRNAGWETNQPPSMHHKLGSGNTGALRWAPQQPGGDFVPEEWHLLVGKFSASYFHL